jgi:flagellar protein FlbT
MPQMNITLRAGERLYINGAVIRVDRKVTIEVLNDVTFLLENHVMQADEASTPLRQIYFAVQIMLMDPASASTAIVLARDLIHSARQAYRTPEIVFGLGSVLDLVNRARYYEALKALRAMYVHEQQEMFPNSATVRPTAA